MNYSNADFYLVKKMVYTKGGVNKAVYRNENICFMAQIKSLFTGKYLMSSIVVSATASVYKTNAKKWTIIEGLEDIPISVASIFDKPEPAETMWTLDDIGPNFVWFPDGRSLFTEQGTYVVQIKIRLSIGNPVVITYKQKIN